MLLQRIAELSAPGSQLALDRISDADSRANEAALEQLSEHSGMHMQDMISAQEHPDVFGWRRHHGWRADERLAQDLAEQYRRELTEPFGSRPTRRGCMPAS